MTSKVFDTKEHRGKFSNSIKFSKKKEDKKTFFYAREIFSHEKTHRSFSSFRNLSPLSSTEISRFPKRSKMVANLCSFFLPLNL